MKKNQNETAQGESRTRTTDRRQGARRAEDLERRLAEVEDITRANRRELHLQFQRMAHMQAEIDQLARRPAPSTPAGDSFLGGDGDGDGRRALAHDSRANRTGR